MKNHRIKLIIYMLIAPFLLFSQNKEEGNSIEFDNIQLAWIGSVPYNIGEFEPQISMDLDNDGAIESLLFVTDGKKWGIDFDKFDGKNRVYEQFFPSFPNQDNAEYNYFGDKTLKVKLHDFDFDNIPELIVSEFNEDEDCTHVTVLKICGAGVDLGKGKIEELSGWIREAGDFYAWYDDWYVNGNLISYRGAQSSFGNPWGQIIYLDNKLKRIAED